MMKTIFWLGGTVQPSSSQFFFPPSPFFLSGESLSESSSSIALLRSIRADKRLAEEQRGAHEQRLVRVACGHARAPTARAGAVRREGGPRRARMAPARREGGPRRARVSWGGRCDALRRTVRSCFRFLVLLFTAGTVLRRFERAEMRMHTFY